VEVFAIIRRNWGFLAGFGSGVGGEGWMPLAENDGRGRLPDPDKPSLIQEFLAMSKRDFQVMRGGS